MCKSRAPLTPVVTPVIVGGGRKWKRSHTTSPSTSPGRTPRPALQDGRSAVVQTPKTRRVRLATSALLALTLASTAAACGSDGDGDTTSGGKIKLTVATFNEFGYEDLIKEYNEMQDDVVVEQKKAGTANEHQDNLYTKLAAGSGLSDIEAIEVDWWSALMEQSDAFVDLSDP